MYCNWMMKFDVLLLEGGSWCTINGSSKLVYWKVEVDILYLEGAR